MPFRISLLFYVVYTIQAAMSVIIEFMDITGHLCLQSLVCVSCYIKYQERIMKEGRGLGLGLDLGLGS